MKDLRFQISLSEIHLEESCCVNRRDGMETLSERAWASICIKPFSAFSAQFHHPKVQTKIRFRQCR